MNYININLTSTFFEFSNFANTINAEMDIYLIMVIALGLLAIGDLVVGVSNDAVNFLNSALGSKALSVRNIMILASLGVAVGAVFSSGMMEVARKGIFNPDMFFFSEIMIIFMAVMITDILLLDFFNTLGMPTSTTVSIVFELLGAAVAVSLIKIFAGGEGVSELQEYINVTKATQIISGILLYAKESFDILNGSTIADFMENQVIAIALVCFIFLSIVSYLLISLLKINIYKIIIGVGTFSLALAFAGNDLVNFIGVPIAAWQSYEAWNISGLQASEFSMEVLATKVPTPTVLLFLAGMVMVVTLWISSKAKKVTKTEIDLARQQDTKEKFSPNFLSRGLVRLSMNISKSTSKLIPHKTKNFIEVQFTKPKIKLSSSRSVDLPAFDMIRAAVNMMVAAILISIATSFKLPLSTTYVTFMVAMGTSLADRAWGSESAVYRVAGVLNVIGGWFFTAFIAFTACGTIAFLINLGGPTAIAILLFFVKHFQKYVI